MAALCYASDKPLDSRDEEIRLFGVSAANRDIDADLSTRLEAHYYFTAGESFKTPGFDYDVSDKVCGDFSITYTPALSKEAARFGFMTQLWGNWFELNDRFKLTFLMKVQDRSAADTWNVVLLDANNQVATTTLKGANTRGEWKAFSIPLNELEKPSDFDLNRIKLVQFEAGKFSEDAVIKLDQIGFSSEEAFFGISDKSVKQRMREAEETNATRIHAAMEQSALNAPFPLMRAFAMLYLNKDLEKANTLILEELEKSRKVHHWDLFDNSMMCRMYYTFSSRTGKFKGRMSAESEKKLLEVLWERTYVKNDIHWARQSVWYLDGSENHDLSSKSSCLVSSRIFMNEPDYKDRIYPDYGFGGGYFYGHAGYQGENPEKRRVEASGGRANLSDGKEYTAEDHYNAWVEFFKEYFPERAKHGFFVETFSPGYSKHTMNMIELAYSFSGDEALSELLNDFIDLYWAAWVQAAPGGILGGPKTRHHKTPGGYGSNADMIRFKLGGPGQAGVWGYWNELSNYKLPKIVWRMALDREGMGNFVYQSRGIGEDVNQLPRPAGTERSLVIEPNSRFIKYVYVTPEYTLGTQMDYPLAVHSHLSCAGRWHGMTVTADSQTRIVPVGIGIEPQNPGITSNKEGEITMEVMYKTAQHENTLIFQRTENYLKIDPDWFPVKYTESRQGVYVGTAWDTVKEDAGWIFVQKGDVYAGIRPVLRDVEFEKAKMDKIRPGSGTFQRPHDDATVKMNEHCYSWNEDKSILLLNDDFTPVIIQSGDKEHFGSFSSFMQKVKNARLELYNTVVQEFDELVYTPPGKNAPEMVFNAASMEIPRIGGEHIHYEYPMTFDSPYIQSEYGTGKIHIKYGDETLDLDFSKSPWWTFRR
jgi:hypothetical protein